MMLCELKQLKKYFPVKRGFFPKPYKYVRAVDHVDLTINRGENLSIVGESGSGKTTLGRVMLRLLPMDSGQIIFDGKDISRLSAKALRPIRQNMQVVFQDPYSSLDPRFSVRRVILEAMVYDQQKSIREKEQRIKELLKAVHLPTDILERYPHEFSGGERQRIAIARALAMNPKLLILDEAVSSLDVLVQEQIIRLLLELQKNFDVTYIFISHNLRVVKKISHKTAVMYQGKIVEMADTDEIFKNPIHPYTKELLAAAIDYRPTQRKEDIYIDPHSSLKDMGNGHFVIG